MVFKISCQKFLKVKYGIIQKINCVTVISEFITNKYKSEIISSIKMKYSDTNGTANIPAKIG